MFVDPPDRVFPPYTYVPGRAPHPIRDPRGHSYGLEEAEVAVPEAGDPSSSAAHRHAVDLFDRGYYWEAHEAWEGLWIAAGRTTPLAGFLKGLIKLAAAGVKVREGVPNGVVRHARRAAELLDAATDDFGGQPVLGLDPVELADRARSIADDPPTCDHADAVPRVVFDFALTGSDQRPKDSS